ASDTDSIDQQNDSVHMMTLHSAKGLEFPYVFIVGLEEGILPHSRSLLSYEEMEEERRLMYVGLTRAKEKIYLLFTRQRTLFGSTQVNPPSRFLDDIPEELKMQSEKIKMENDSFSPNFKNYSQPKKDRPELRDGDRVRHEEFGDGVVISVMDDLIVIAFKKVGIKRISTEYSNLKKI
ncbi:MAG TPA: ATP-dependent DNA helicase PcrA, partial [Candidatus Moranbacteria bacterium]|nr:ATP-dependent DNA helicase PcrA [Candidatus Moranbacteria bacterium]